MDDRTGRSPMVFSQAPRAAQSEGAPALGCRGVAEMPAHTPLSWVKTGRPVNGSVSGVASYLDRVLHDRGVGAGISATPRQPRAGAPSDCAALGAWEKTIGDLPVLSSIATRRFYDRLDNAMSLAVRNARLQ